MSSGFWTVEYGDCPYVNDSQLELESGAEELPFTFDGAVTWLSCRMSWLVSPVLPRLSSVAEWVRIVDSDPRLR